MSDVTPVFGLTKAQLRLELIHKAQERGILLGWIGVDSYYGQ